MNPIISVISTYLAAAVLSGFSTPKIVSSEPKFWAVGVNATAQKSILLKFDQRMRLDSSSWFGNLSVAPEEFGESSISEDQISISLPVTLKAAKVYVFSLNESSGPGLGFQNVRGIPLARKFLVFQTAGTPKPEDAPPRALGTLPASGAQDVNPATAKAVVVTFDKAMNPKKHGLHLFENKQEVDLKTASFTYSPDGKIFTLNYPLKPSTRYEVVMNSTEDIGFAATKRVPLWPVRFSFTTGQPH